jgi:hypothetical protein
MDQDEQRDTTAGQRIEDPRRFEEPAREVREEQGSREGRGEVRVSQQSC